MPFASLPQVSPPSLVYAPAAASRRTLSLLLDPKPLSNSASPEEHRWEVPDEPSPQLLSREQLLRCAGGSLTGGEGGSGTAGSGAIGRGSDAAAAGAPASGAPAAPAGAPSGTNDGRSAGQQEAPAGGRVIGKDVQVGCSRWPYACCCIGRAAWHAVSVPAHALQFMRDRCLTSFPSSLHPCTAAQAAFQRFPQLLAFATRMPSAAAAQQFEGWAEKLESHISDLPPPLPTGGECGVWPSRAGMLYLACAFIHIRS